MTHARLGKFYLVMSALFTAAASMSNPDYYLAMVLSFLFATAAYFLLASPINKRLLLISYSAVCIYSFVIGRIFFANHELTTNGIMAMLLTFPVIAFVLKQVYSAEPRAA